MCWILLQETDWLTGYFCTTRQCYSQRFEDVYKTSTINVAEAYFLPSNWVFNIITLKIKLLSPNSWFNPNLRGFLGVRFKVWMGGGAKSSPPPPHLPYLKHVRIMLEPWNLACKYTPNAYVVLEMYLLVLRPS